MASTTLSVANPAAGKPVPVQLTEAEISHNHDVDDFKNKILGIMREIEDMKLRGFESDIKSDVVYSKKAANKSQINAYAAAYRKLAEKVDKLKRGKTKESAGGYVGFSTPGYINQDMARVIGIVEGQSPLWETGGRPICSAANLTCYFTHVTKVQNLRDPAQPKIFRCNEVMTRLFSPYIATSGKPGPDGRIPPIDLQKMTFPDLQKLITNFVDKRGPKNPGPYVKPNLENKTDAISIKGAQIFEVFKMLDERFKNLSALSKDYNKAHVAAEQAKQDIIVAQQEVTAGEISPLLFEAYRANYQNCEATQLDLRNKYYSAAQQMGIQ